MAERSEISSIASLIRDAIDVFTPSERKVARALLAHYPLAGLETVAELADRSGVSSPTVLRFVVRLGFDGYPGFQRALIHEVHEHRGSPIERIRERTAVAEGPILELAPQVFATHLLDSFEELPASEFRKCVSLLAETRRRIHVMGGHFSGAVAGYLQAHLELLREDVHLVPSIGPSRWALLADEGRRDVLVVFDYRRYDDVTVSFARAFAEAGGTVILFTDTWMSPAADFAGVVLPVHVESPSAFDSLVPALALSEVVVAALAEALGDSGKDRLSRLESLRTTDVGSKQTPRQRTPAPPSP